MYNNKNGKIRDNDIGNRDISNSTVNNNKNGKETANEENPYNLTGKAFENPENGSRPQLLPLHQLREELHPDQHD